MHTNSITLTASVICLYGAVILLAAFGAAAMGVWYGRRHAPDDNWTHPDREKRGVGDIDYPTAALDVPCEQRPAQPPRPPLMDPRLTVPHSNVDILPGGMTAVAFPVNSASHADAFLGQNPVDLPIPETRREPEPPSEDPTRSWVSRTLWGGRTAKEIALEIQENAALAVADYEWRGKAARANAQNARAAEYGTYEYRGATLLV